ncbi:MAG: ATP-binding cassette domain-containing protein, partial [Owenweeksia sp.]
MIQAQGIEKHYGDLKVLKGVNFEAKAAEIVTIVGASGAGKTTFLQILGTLENPDRGTLMFRGENILERSPKKLA